MSPEVPTPPSATPPASDDARWDTTSKVLLAIAAALVAVAVLRALTLGGELYDAYEVRVEARRLLSGASVEHRPAYRSPLLILAAAACEALGPTAGWVGPALLSALAYAALVALGVLLARRVGAPPWAAALTGALLATDHVTFVYAAHGMSDVPAAAACALVLYLALAPPDGEAAERAAWRRAVGVGLALGLAALLRPNVGLLGLALLAAARGGRDVIRLALTAACAVGVYLAVTWGYYLLALRDVSRALGAPLEVVRFMGEQVQENRARYGPHAPPLASLRGLFLSSPWLCGLAAAGALAAWRARGEARRGLGAGAVLAAWAGLHGVIGETLVGHYEARYALPAVPALAGLAALALAAIDRRWRAREGGAGWRPTAFSALVLATTLLWSAPYEARRLLDPRSRASFAARLAAEARVAAGPEGRLLWTTAHPFPVLPAVVHERPPYAGDPYFATYHVGPLVLGYHLARPVSLLLARDAQGRPLAGLTEAGELRALARDAGLRPGDLLLVGIARPSRAWDIAGQPLPPFGIGRVVAGPDGLDVDLRWIPQP